MTVPFAARAPGASSAATGVAPPQDAAPDHVDLGPLAVLAAEEGVTDVFVLGDGSLWYDRGRGVERAGGMLDAVAARELAVRLVSIGGRHVDESKP